MIGFLRWYWDWAGSNIGAMPGCGIVATAVGWLVRKPALAWWHRHLSVRTDLEDIRHMSESAHKIAADLFERVTGERHELHPEQEDAR